MASAISGSREIAEVCLGIPARVVERLTADSCLAEFCGEQRQISLALLSDERVDGGDWVYVHSGFALGRMTEVEAQETMDMLADAGRGQAP